MLIEKEIDVDFDFFFVHLTSDKKNK